MWIPMCGGLVLSIITSIIGARKGRRTVISDKPLTKLAGIPSWALALLTLFGVTILMFGIGEGLGPYIKIKGEIGDAIPYILYGIVVAVCCYFIVKKNPSSIWYVPHHLQCDRNYCRYCRAEFLDKHIDVDSYVWWIGTINNYINNRSTEREKKCHF